MFSDFGLLLVLTLFSQQPITRGIETTNSSVFATLQIFAKCSETVADRRDGARRGRVRLNTIGRVAALAAATMVVAAAVTMMMRARVNKSGSPIALERRVCVAWSQPAAAGMRDACVCNAADMSDACVCNATGMRGCVIDGCETQSCVRHAIYCGRACRCFSSLGAALHARQGAARDDDARTMNVMRKCDT